MRRVVARQPVELVVERRQTAHRQPFHAERRDQAARTAGRARHIFHHRIAHVLHRDAVVADLRAFAGQLPEFALLVPAVAVNEQIRHAQMLTVLFGWLTGSPRMSTGQFASSASRRMVAVPEPRRVWLSRRRTTGWRIEIFSGGKTTSPPLLGRASSACWI